METLFSQANLSPEQGTQLMQALGIDAWDIQNPDIFARYEHIASYLSRFSDAALLARSVGRHASKGDRLAKMTEYVNLRKALEEIRKKKAELSPHDMIKDEEDTALRAQIDAEEQSLLKEIYEYER